MRGDFFSTIGDVANNEPITPEMILFLRLTFLIHSFPRTKGLSFKKFFT